MNKTITIIIIALVVVIGGYFLLRGGYQAPQETGTQPPSLGVPAPGFESVPETAVVTGENSIAVANQPLGNSVIVASVQFVDQGFVVIHEDADGKPGPVIGNSDLLTAAENVRIDLIRETVAGETLYAMLHQDDGDGIYEFPGDDVPLKDEEGKVVLSKFLITEVEEIATPSVREISAVSGNFFFNPDNLTLTKGQPVRITFQNSGVHTFTIDELGVNVPLRGSSVVVEFTPTKSGTFEYYCAVPGHREGGMFGSLTVE